MNIEQIPKNETSKSPADTPFGEEYLKDIPSFSEKQENDKRERLEEFERFFTLDSRIKETMLEMAPKEADGYDEESRIKYADKLYEDMREIISDFEKMGNAVPDSYHEKLTVIMQKLVEAGFNMDKMSAFYRANISDMSPDFAKKVDTEVSGYSIERYDGRDAKTVNEMLHFVHTDKINNELSLQDLPVIEKTINGYDSVNLYGYENESAKQIFDLLKKQQDLEYAQQKSGLGITHIVALKDKIIMMVRDSGHALTIEIEKDENPDKFFVKYHVPKICNAEKVNQLPGINKVPADADFQTGTSGRFLTNRATIGETIQFFINQVPTDSDIDYR